MRVAGVVIVATTLLAACAGDAASPSPSPVEPASIAPSTPTTPTTEPSPSPTAPASFAQGDVVFADDLSAWDGVWPEDHFVDGQLVLSSASGGQRITRTFGAVLSAITVTAIAETAAATAIVGLVCEATAADGLYVGFIDPADSRYGIARFVGTRLDRIVADGNVPADSRSEHPGPIVGWEELSLTCIGGDDDPVQLRFSLNGVELAAIDGDDVFEDIDEFGVYMALAAGVEEAVTAAFDDLVVVAARPGVDRTQS